MERVKVDYFGNSMARYLKTLDAIPTDIQKKENAAILDIGGYSVFEEMLANTYKFNNIQTFATADLNTDTLPFAGNTFDLVILGEVIEHLYDPDKIMSECNRILKSNGVLLITTPNLVSWYNRLLLVSGYYPMNLDISCFVRKSGKRDILQKLPLNDVKLNPLYDVHIKLYTFDTLEILYRAHDFSNIEKNSYTLDKSAHRNIGWLLKIMNKFFGNFNNLSQGIIMIGRKK